MYQYNNNITTKLINKKQNVMNIKKHIQKTVMLIALSLPLTFLFANNIQVSNVKLVEQNTFNQYTMVKFDISWQNSWRFSTLESNWDAAWIFVKYRRKSETVWHHARLNDTGHVAPTNSKITSGLSIVNQPFNAKDNPAVGVFLYRETEGSGSVNYTGVKLRWNYSANDLKDHDSVEVCVFAIEMVYIPTGSFYAGDNVYPGSKSIGYFVTGTTTDPFLVTSEDALTIGNNTTTEIWATSRINPAGTLSAEFPKGYQSFYIMKYELSQYMYKEFLNKLTRTQQETRVSAITTNMFMTDTDTATTPQYRNGIKVMSDPGGLLPRVYGNDLNNNGTEGEYDDGQYIACNWLSFYDLLAFADWSGLRPFTELEYEKACRGTLGPVASEYAWGTSNITYATGITNPGETDEVAANTGANIAFNNEAGVQGPLRCGNFAGAATNREQAGASYYGVMEMSGNLSEYVYSLGLSNNRNFNGNIHGDGVIQANGDTDTKVADWPNNAGLKGSNWLYRTGPPGGYSHQYKAHHVSARNQTSQIHETTGRWNTSGLRVARTQP